MDQGQRSGVVTAAYLLVVATSAVLYCRGSASGRRQWSKLDSTQSILLVVFALGWVFWVASTKVVRPWAAALGIKGHWTLAVAPSFIAGITVAAFAGFILVIMNRLGAMFVFLCGAVPMLLLEVIQLWLPGYVFDPFDVLAGTSGAALVAILLHWRADRDPNAPV